MGLQCPNCGSEKYKVLDSRQSTERPAIRRRRQCLDCEFLFSTNETLVRRIQVLDRKGNAQPYSTYRLKLSLADATQGSRIYLEQAINDLEDDILTYAPKKKSIPSSYIAQRVMVYLKTRDWVSYVRYAINHANAANLDAFIDLLVRGKEEDVQIVDRAQEPDDLEELVQDE